MDTSSFITTFSICLLRSSLAYAAFATFRGNMALVLESKHIYTEPEVMIAGSQQDFDLQALLVSAGLRVFHP